MSPNVVFAAQHLPFSAADYTWIDLKEAPFITQERIDTFLTTKKFDKKALESPESFKDLPLPFETFALIPPAVLFGNILVLTIHRKETEMLVDFWQMGANVNTVKARIFREGAEDVVSIRYDARVKAARLREKALTDQYVKILYDIFLVITHFSGGVYGDTYEAHTCKEDTQLNAKRRKKHKKPLYDWVSVVMETKPRAVGHGGTHAPPRQHDVRGHYAKSKLGKLFWRKAHKRGDPTLGTVFHDYVVRSNNNGVQQPMQPGA